MKSTLENPLHFFEYIIDEVSIKKELEDRLKFSDYKSFYIELPTDINYVEEDEYGNIKPGKATIESELIQILRNQFEISKKLLKNAYLNNDANQNRNFLNIQFNTIQSLIKRKTGIINKYPYLLLPLRGLVRFINDKLRYPEMKDFELNEEGIQYEPSSHQQGSFVLKKDTEIIHEVLDYMSKENQRREEILSKEDFNLLMQYTTYLVENKKLPEVVKKIKPNLSNDTIRFSFYVVYKELNYSNKIRPLFIEFIKLVFESFKDNELSSIENQFGTKTRVKADTFLPEIILEHRKKKKST